MMVVFIALTVLIIAWVLRAVGLGRQSDSKVRDTPLDTLKHRFARSEIDHVTYRVRFTPKEQTFSRHTGSAAWK